MIKAPINLQDLRRRIYVKAKAESTWRFWGLYVHLCKMGTLQEAYQMAKSNNGAPGIDGVKETGLDASHHIRVSPEGRAKKFFLTSLEIFANEKDFGD